MMRINNLSQIDVFKCEPTKNSNMHAYYMIDALSTINDNFDEVDSVHISMSKDGAQDLREKLNEHLGNKTVYIYDGQYELTDEGCVVKLINNAGDEVNIGKSAIKDLYCEILKDGGLDLDDPHINKVESNDVFIRIKTSYGIEIRLNKNILKDLYKKFGDKNTDNKKEPIGLDSLRIKSVEKNPYGSYVTVKTNTGDIVEINEHTIKSLFDNFIPKENFVHIDNRAEAVDRGAVIKITAPNGKLVTIDKDTIKALFQLYI